MNDTTLTAKSGSTMAWFHRHSNIWRVTILFLLLVAIAGPWTYSADGVPPAEWCQAPNILLTSDRCVKLESGATILTIMVSVLLGIGPALVSGMIGIGEFFRELLFVLLLFLLVLPFFSTLVLLWGRDRRRLYLFHRIAWGLAFAVGLLVAITGWSGLSTHLWGIWLYIALAASALILELLLHSTVH